VSDPQGLATGRWILRVDDQGAGTVTPWDEDEAPAHAVGVRLGIAELSAAYLGGVSLATLAAAGRVRTTDASTATRIFSWHVTPQLSFWY
nr:sterol carrier protein domain-containing protein [Candidatus Nanopelagicales bacterium]